MERPGKRGEAPVAPATRQRDRQAVAPKNRKGHTRPAGPPDHNGGNGRRPGSRRTPATTGPAQSPAAQQPAAIGSLLRATGEIAAARNIPEVAEMLRAEITRVLSGVDCRIDVYLGKTKPYTRLLDTGADDGIGTDEPGSMPPDALLQQALQQRRLSWAAVDGPIRLVIPLLSRNEAWGYIDVRACRSGPPSDEEAAYLQLLASCAATVLEIACLRRSVGNQAMTDSVTGFYSGWHFHERLYSETARAQRYGQPLSAVVFEIDGFEEFVEDRGQAAGTYLLRAVSRLLKGSMRQKVDLVYRCGGARFALLLPNTPSSREGAALVAERMRGALEVTDFRTGDDELLGRFTLSAGVAGYPAQCDDADELATAAEEALCEAKSAGKNRVRIYHE
jgi:diguanylate cyclase (GGDEF)-like protein